jgi:hypothetical protein
MDPSLPDAADDPAPARRRPCRAALSLLGAVLLFGLGAVFVLHDDSGATWDESVQAEYAELVLAYFRSGGEDRRCNEYLDLRYYGPLFELVPAALSEGEPFDAGARHLFMGLVALLALPLAAFCAWSLADEVSGFVAMLALVTLPRFVGHAFTNSKDVPLAVATCAYAALLMVLVGRGGPSLRKGAATGVVLGIALAARPGAFPLLAVWLVGALAAWVVSDRFGRRSEAKRESREETLLATRRAGSAAALALAIGWTLMVLPWPWAHAAPLARPLESMAASARFPATVPVLFEGVVLQGAEVPLSYLPKMLAITTPIPHLLLALAGLSVLVWRVLRSPASERALRSVVFLAFPLLPLIAYFVVHPEIYDGVRHFLFLFPLFAILVAVGVSGIVSAAPPRFRRVLAAGLGASLLLPLPAMVKLHPYQVAYFNSLVGGLPGAEGRYDTEYWLASHGEALDWINARAAERPAGSTVHVLIGGDQTERDSVATRAGAGVVVHSLSGYSSLRGQGQAPPVDFFVITKRNRLDERLAVDAPVVHEVGRLGVVFTVVKSAPTRSAPSETAEGAIETTD